MTKDMFDWIGYLKKERDKKRDIEKDRWKCYLDGFKRGLFVANAIWTFVLLVTLVLRACFQ